MTDGDEEANLLTSLEGAMRSARALGMRDLELILKMAALELLNHHTRQQAPVVRSIRGRLRPQ